MASMREIKRRRSSIESTAQITRAMKLVSTVKFQKAKGKAEDSRAYFDKMYETVVSILERTDNVHHPYVEGSDTPKKAVILMTSNRGLAGGYNSNVIRQITDMPWNPSDVILFTVGRKGRETLGKKGYTLGPDYSDAMEAPMYRDAQDIGRAVLELFAKDEVGEIWLAYTAFKNTIVHIPRLLRLLPVDRKDPLRPQLPMTDEDDASAASGTAKTTGASGSAGSDRDGAGTAAGPLVPMNYVPDAEEALEAIIPRYINSLIYGALVAALASENGARMTAMDNATDNAQEMIDDLTLSYNRARQTAITQEITEIVSGSEALS